jgi:hypothetical protein
VISVTRGLTSSSKPMQIKCVVAHALGYAIGMRDLTSAEARSLWLQMGYSQRDWASFHPMLYR